MDWKLGDEIEIHHQLLMGENVVEGFEPSNPDVPIGAY
jgi:hypothetical protein